MASQTINKTMKVKVEYTGVIDDLLKSLGKVKKVTKEATSLSAIDKGMNKLLSIQKQIDAKGGLLNAEEAKLFGGQIEKVIKSMGSVSKELFAMFSKDGQKAITALAAKVKEESTKLGGKKRSLASSEKRVTKGIDGNYKVDETNKSFMSEINKAEVQGFSEMNVTKDEIPARKKAQEELNAALLKTNALSKKQKEMIKDTGIDENKRLDIAREFVATGETQLTAQQIVDNLNEQATVEAKKTAIYEKEITKQAKLQKEIAVDQIELDKDKKKQTELIVAETKNLTGVGQDFDKDMTDNLLKIKKETKDLTTEEKKRLKVEKDLLKTGKKGAKVVEKQEGALKKATKQVLSYGLAFTMLRRLYRETIQTITELDEALTEMAIVTTMSREDTWELVGTMQTLAKETGFTTTEIAKLSTVYFRQGRNLKDVIELTTVAAKAARIAGISAAESADFLTSAVNGFGLAASEALAVSDKFAALAASSASSYEELAKGLSKFAAQANVAGLSMNFALGMLAKGVETTREAPETIGTALKTVLARLRELTDYGKTLEDGMDVNRVETALGAMNVELMDSNGQFRDMESVLTDLGGIWDTLNTNQQASIAVALAGTRQQSRLIAVMQDFDRTLELVSTAEGSAGATMAQHVEYMRSMEAAMVGLQNAWQEFITTISDSDFIISIINGIAQGILMLGKGLEKIGASGSNAMVIIIGIGVAMKGLTIITAMNAKVTAFAAGGQAKLTMAQGASILATKLQTRGLVKNIAVYAVSNKMTLSAARAHFVNIGAITAEEAATLEAAAATTVWNAALALNPFVLLAVAIVALAIGIGYFSGATEKAAAKFKKMSEEIQAANFELSQTNKKIDGLIVRLDELNGMSFLTDEQKEELATLKESLGEALPKEVLAKLTYINGQIDYESSQAVIADFYAQNEEDQVNNFKELASKTMSGENRGSSLLWDMPWSPQYQRADKINYDESFQTPEEQKAVVDYYMAEYKRSLGEGYEDLSLEEVKAYRDYLDNTIMNDPAKMISFDADPTKDFFNWEDYLTAAAQEFMGESSGISDFISEVHNAIESEDLSFSDKIANMRSLLTNSNETEIAILKKQYSKIVGMTEEFSQSQILAMEEVGLIGVEDIQKGLELYGDNLNTLIASVKTQADALVADGMSKTQAYTMAWTNVSRSAETAEQGLWLYAQAFSDTILEAAQTLDSIQSKIENINKIQKEWMEGSLSSQDLYSFFEDNADLFQTMEDVERFLSGGGIDDKRFIAAIEAERESIAGLYHYQMLLNRATEGTVEYQEALVKVAYYRALLQSTSVMATLTIEQQKYNNALEQYNILTKMGIEDSVAQGRLNEAKLVFTQTAINGTIKGMADIESRFSDTVSSIEGLAGGFKDYFEVVNGVVVPLYGEMNNLTKTQMDYLIEMMNSYQEQLTEAFDVFQDLRDSELKAEKEKLDEMKSLYTQYFKDIDAAEKKADSKKTRETITAQLQRLEGATDESSRKKALDLRKELNALDEKTAADSTKDARAALLESFDGRYDELVTKWAEVGQQFISDMASGGSAAADAMINKLFAAGLITQEESDLALETTTDGTTLDPLDSEDMGGLLSAEEREAEVAANIVKVKKEAFIAENLENEKKVVSDEFRKDLILGNMTQVDIDKIARQRLNSRFNATDSINSVTPVNSGRSGDREYAKGGLVDYTGLAQVHGSSSSPEMVLDANQTQMFMNLRDILGKISVSGGNSESINIEKIEIKTDKLNGNQDFNAAGKVLANAFSKAIKNRGITANVKR